MKTYHVGTLVKFDFDEPVAGGLIRKELGSFLVESERPVPDYHLISGLLNRVESINARLYLGEDGEIYPQYKIEWRQLTSSRWLDELLNKTSPPEDCGDVEDPGWIDAPPSLYIRSLTKPYVKTMRHAIVSSKGLFICYIGSDSYELNKNTGLCGINFVDFETVPRFGEIDPPEDWQDAADAAEGPHNPNGFPDMNEEEEKVFPVKPAGAAGVDVEECKPVIKEERL